MSPSVPVSRRAFLAGAAALVAAPVGSMRPAWGAAPGAAQGAVGPRVATLDWAHLETLLALGADVVAGPELTQFRSVAVEPVVPQTVADLGLRGLPNLETLALARPELIFNSNYYAWADPLIAPIATTHNLSIYLPDTDPYVMAEKASVDIAGHLGVADTGAYAAETGSRLDDLRKSLSQGDGRPVLLVNLGDARHYRVFGSDSMFGSVLKRLGLVNAWSGATAYSATAPIGIETLASMPDARIVFIPPHPLDAMATLQRSSFWRALPAVRERRVLVVGSVNPYGALPAARRFAEELAKGLTDVWNG